jgi:hypothetical protein
MHALEDAAGDLHQHVEAQRFVGWIGGVYRGKFHAECPIEYFADHNLFLNEGTVGVVQMELDFKDAAGRKEAVIVQPDLDAGAGHVQYGHVPFFDLSAPDDHRIGSREIGRLAVLFAFFDDDPVSVAASAFDFHLFGRFQMPVIRYADRAGMLAFRASESDHIVAGDKCL